MEISVGTYSAWYRAHRVMDVYFDERQRSGADHAFFIFRGNNASCRDALYERIMPEDLLRDGDGTGRC